MVSSTCGTARTLQFGFAHARHLQCDQPSTARDDDRSPARARSLHKAMRPAHRTCVGNGRYTRACGADDPRFAATTTQATTSQHEDALARRGATDHCMRMHDADRHDALARDFASLVAIECLPRVLAINSVLRTPWLEILRPNT